jgi:hypothetical protein
MELGLMGVWHFIDERDIEVVMDGFVGEVETTIGLVGLDKVQVGPLG